MRCGVGDYAATLANALQELGNVTVGVLVGESNVCKPVGVEIIQGPGWRLRYAFAVLRTIIAWRPDVVHLQFPTQGYGGRLLPLVLPLLLRAAGCRIVQTWHEFLPMGSHHSSFVLCAARGTVIVVRSNYIASLSGWYRWLLRRSKIVFIPGASSVPQSQLSVEELAHLREKLAAGQQRVITYFGFANPNKGVEQLFQIANPERDRIVMLCDLQPANPYQRKILDESKKSSWANKVTVTGFLPAQEAADILAASDAVVLPFPGGGGNWNSSLAAIRAQGTLAITTSLSREGYDSQGNVYFCEPGDVEAMGSALTAYLGRKIIPSHHPEQEWMRIAASHFDVYRDVLAQTREAK